MFDTKIAIVIHKELAGWQKLNVAAFMTSGILGTAHDLLGEPYEDAAGNRYNRLIVQPMIVLTADGETMRAIHGRALERGVRLSLYVKEMFETGHDAANRAAVKALKPEEMSVVGLALRDDRKLVDKITKGAVMHP